MSKMFYPKIETVFNRGDDFAVNGELRYEEFGYVNRWVWMEKIDGSNISLYNSELGTQWRGRTERANFTREVREALDDATEALDGPLTDARTKHGLATLEIFGEVYGPKVQSGGIYSDHIKTTFYDMRANGTVWLSHADFMKFANETDLNVPAHGYDSLESLVAIVQYGFDTLEKGGSGGTAEGVIAKTPRPLYINNGNRLMWKLKHKDFK